MKGYVGDNGVEWLPWAMALRRRSSLGTTTLYLDPPAGMARRHGTAWFRHDLDREAFALARTRATSGAYHAGFADWRDALGFLPLVRVRRARTAQRRVVTP